MERLKLLFLDVDGTLTDGKIYMGADGEVFKAFDSKDGYAIHELLPQNGIVPVIITARDSPITAGRCRELGITRVYQGCNDKRGRMLSIAAEYGIVPDDEGVLRGTAYMGDDILDLKCMELSEYSGCPCDAVWEVKFAADFVSAENGGCGAVRDFIEWLLRRCKG